MFSGIIQTQGAIHTICKTSGGSLFTFSTSENFLDEVKVGDSIASNGVCLTVVKIYDKYFDADLSNETLNLTSFKFLKINDKVNFEKSLRFNQGIDGHLVSGHIDDLAEVINKITSGDNVIFKIQVPNNLTKYIAKKGSITLNGVSLTVNEIIDDIFSINVVPHTLKSTNFYAIKIGDKLNIEVDIIARHLEKLIATNNK